MVVATENPVDQYGTYPLPEGQLDRFTMTVSVGYPDDASAGEIVRRQLPRSPDRRARRGRFGAGGGRASARRARDPRRGAGDRLRRGAREGHARARRHPARRVAARHGLAHAGGPVPRRVRVAASSCPTTSRRSRRRCSRTGSCRAAAARSRAAPRATSFASCSSASPSRWASRGSAHASAAPARVRLVGGALLLFVVGTSVQAGWLLVLASCLLGATAAGFVLPGRMLRGLEWERRAPAEAYQGDEVRVSIVGLEPDLRPPARARSGRRAPRARAGVPAEGLAGRARHRGDPQDRRTPRRPRRSGRLVASAAPFGVAERRRRVAVASPTVVYPRLVRLDELPFLESAPTPERAIHSAPRRGTGPDYLGIREYRVGDSMRHVHWPSTARHGALMVREFEREQTRRLAVVIDDRRRSPSPGRPRSTCAARSRRRSRSRRRAPARGSAWSPPSAVAPCPCFRRTPPPRCVGWPSCGPAAGCRWPARRRLGEEVLGAATLLLAAPTWRANDPPRAAIADLVLASRAVIVVLVEVDMVAGSRRVPDLDSGERGRVRGRSSATRRSSTGSPPTPTSPRSCCGAPAGAGRGSPSPSGCHGPRGCRDRG